MGYRKLNPEFKKRWVRALRSGRYLPGTGSLRQRVFRKGKPQLEYCCLGVGLNVAGNRHWKLQRGGTCMDYGTSSVQWDATKGLGFVSDHMAEKLANMNDKTVYDPEQGCHVRANSFNDIADWIEEYL